jgi:transglutaminase-like putative cysteine protease
MEGVNPQLDAIKAIPMTLIICKIERLRFLIAIVIGLVFHPPLLATSIEPEATPLVIERVVYTFIVEADGSSREISSSTERLTSDIGASQYGESYFNYSTSQDTFKVYEAYTLTPEGRRIDVSPQAIRHIDSNEDGDAAMFTDSKDVVIIFSNTSVGAKIVTLTEKNNHAPAYPGHYTKALSTSDRYITEQAEYRFFFHPTLTLQRHSYGLKEFSYAPLSPNFSSLQRHAESQALGKGYKFLGFKYENSHAKRREPSEADVGENGTLLVISTIKDHKAFADLYQQRSDPKVKVTTEILKKALELTQGQSDDFAKARSIYNWINQNIRYVAIHLGDGGLVPHDADSVFRNRYGDCKDHVILFETMLEAVGIESEAVFVNLGRRYHLPSVPLTYPFNHVISYIPSLNLYADPTAQFFSFGDLPFEVADKPVVHAKTGKVSRTPQFDPKLNLTRTTTLLRLRNDGVIEGHIDVESNGNHEANRRALTFDRQDQDPNKIVRSIFAENREVGTGTILSSDPRDMEQTLKLKAEFEITFHLDLPGPSAFLLPVGLSPGMLAQWTIYKPTEGRTKFFTCEPERIEESIRLDLGKSIKITKAPSNVRYHSGPVHYESKIGLVDSPSGQILQVIRTLEINPKSHICSPDSQTNFQELFRVMRKDLRQLIFYD